MVLKKLYSGIETKWIKESLTLRRLSRKASEEVTFRRGQRMRMSQLSKGEAELSRQLLFLRG